MHLGESKLLNEIDAEALSLDGWDKGIKAGLKRILVQIPRERLEVLFEEASAKASELIVANDAYVSGRKSLRLIIFASRLLGLYRALSPLLGQAAARAALSDALTETSRSDVKYYLARDFGIFQENTEAAFDILADKLVKRSGETAERMFKLEVESRDETGLSVNIKKCFFKDFFERCSAKELTYLICSMEDVWTDELEKPEYGIQLERSATLADGAEACRYCLSRRTPAGSH